MGANFPDFRAFSPWTPVDCFLLTFFRGVFYDAGMGKAKKYLFDETGRIYDAGGRLVGRGVVCVRLPSGKFEKVCDLRRLVCPGIR